MKFVYKVSHLFNQVLQQYSLVFTRIYDLQTQGESIPLILANTLPVPPAALAGMVT